MKSVFVVLALLVPAASFAAELRIANAHGGLFAMDKNEFELGEARMNNIVPGNEGVAKFLASIPDLKGTVCDATFYTIGGVHYVYSLKDCTPFQ